MSLEDIRQRDAISAETWFKEPAVGACGRAFIDRRWLLAEVDRLRAELRRIRDDSLVWAMTCQHQCPSCNAMYESIKRSVEHPTGDPTPPPTAFSKP